MKSSRTSAICVIVAVALLAACGSDDDAASSATTTAEASAESSASSAADTTVAAENTTAVEQSTVAVETTVAATETTATASADVDTTPAIVAAANAFLDTLADDERSSVSFDFTDTTQRQLWSNLPEGLFQRDGLMWGDLREETQNAWLALMQVTLSADGYERVLAEWTADDQLAGDGGLSYGMQYYWVAIIGTPSETEPWQWQWGGHHVTVNATVVGSEISLTPSFIGVQPGTYDLDGNEIRPLGDIEDEAFALVDSLDATQQGAAVLGDTLIDLVLGPGEDGRTIESEGLAGSAMTAEQQAAMLQLIGHYGELANDEDAAARMAELEAGLADTYFAWYGPTTAGSGMYFRITGPTIVIEYSGQSMGGDAADHVHGIYRDPTNDYGAALGAGLS